MLLSCPANSRVIDPAKTMEANASEIAVLVFIWFIPFRFWYEMVSISVKYWESAGIW